RMLGEGVEVVQEAEAELAEAAAIAAGYSQPLALRRALGELAGYSMISLDEDSFFVHRLVQTVQRDALNEPARRLWAERAVLLVNRSFPNVEFLKWTWCARLLPHARAASELITAWRIASPLAARLLSETASYLFEVGQNLQAEPLYLQALAIIRKIHGEDH